MCGTRVMEPAATPPVPVSSSPGSHQHGSPSVPQDGWALAGLQPTKQPGGRTVRLDPAEAAKPSVPPKPALSRAARRLPGAPARIPITPRPAMIVAGVVVLAISLWALFGYLPSMRPPPHEQTPQEAALIADTTPTSAVGEAVYIAGTLAAIGLLVIGLGLIVAGALYRAQTEVMCRRCNQQVVGWKTSFGLMCPLGKHYARIRWLLVGVTVLFWVTAAALMAVVVVIMSKS